MKNKIKTALVHSALVVVTAAAAVAVGSQVPKLTAHLRGNVKDGDFALHVANQPQQLTLYGTTTCPHCVKARQYLRKAGFAFNDRVIDTSPDSRVMFAKLNEGGVPVLVSRTGLIIGFNPAAYDELARDSGKQ
jgi:glutaredoxin 3